MENDKLAKWNDANSFASQVDALKGAFGDEFHATEQLQQLFPDSLRLDNSNVGLTEGGLLLGSREVETEFGNCHIHTFSRADKTEFEVIFPSRITEKLAELQWGVGSVLAFQWRGYVQLPKGKKMKNLAIVKLGEVASNDKPTKKGRK